MTKENKLSNTKELLVRALRSLPLNAENISVAIKRAINEVQNAEQKIVRRTQEQTPLSKWQEEIRARVIPISPQDALRARLSATDSLAHIEKMLDVEQQKLEGYEKGKNNADMGTILG